MSLTCTTADALIQYYSFSPDLSMSCQNILAAKVASVDLALSRYIKFFAATVLLEMPFYAVGIFYFMRIRINFAKFVGLNIILNLATHPLVCYGFPTLGERLHWSYADYVCVAEVFAPLVEGILLFAFLKGNSAKSFFIAIVANLFSWNMGALLTNLLGAS